MDLNSTKNVKALGIIGIFLILAAGFMLVVQPLLSQNSEYSQQFDAAEAEQVEMQSKLELLRTQRDTIADVEELDAELSKQFPGTADTPGLINMVATAATSSGLDSSNITNLTAGIPTLVATTTGGTEGGEAAPAPDAAAGGEADPAPEAAPVDPAAAPVPGSTGTSNIAEIPLEISIEGGVDQISEFVNNLKEVDRNVTILSFSVSAEGEGEEATTSASIQAKTYIYNTVPKISEQPAPTQESAEPAVAPTP